MKHRTLAGLLIALIAVLVLSQSVIVVPQGDTGVVLRFQKRVRSGLAPGPHFKWPFIDHPVYLSASWIVHRRIRNRRARPDSPYRETV